MTVVLGAEGQISRRGTARREICPSAPRISGSEENYILGAEGQITGKRDFYNQLTSDMVQRGHVAGALINYNVSLKG